MALKKTDPIVIVGAGIFGLSTALHLARRGYTNVTVLDKNEYDRTQYSYLNGCDAASAGKDFSKPSDSSQCVSLLTYDRHQQDHTLRLWCSDRVPGSLTRSHSGMERLEYRDRVRLPRASRLDQGRPCLYQQWPFGFARYSRIAGIRACND